MTNFKQHFNLVEGYLAAALSLSGSTMVGIDLLQKGDFKTAGAFFVSGLITSAFYFFASVTYQKRNRYRQLCAMQNDELKEGFAELYAKLDELEKRG